MEIGTHCFQHIAVAVLDLHRNTASAILSVQIGSDLAEIILFGFQLGCIVVPQDIIQGRCVDIPLHIAQVIEPLAAVGRLRPCHHRQRCMEFHRQVAGIDHLALGAAGVDRQPPEGDGRIRGIEVLVFDAAHIAAVNGIGKIGTKTGDIKQQCAFPDLLIRRKADAQLAMGEVFRQQGLYCGQDLCHTRLIICTQQRSAIGRDQGLPFHAGQKREGGYLHHGTGARQCNVLAVVMLVQHRTHPLTAGIGSGIHMGDQAQSGLVLAARGSRQAGIYIAMLVCISVLHA